MPACTARSRLRRSLHACTAEGIAAEVVGAASGGLVLTGWALHLGLAPERVALLCALPFTAHLFQLPGALLTSRVGSRRAALACVGLSRQLFLPLALLPWLPLAPEAARRLLVGVALAHHAISILGNNAWTAWMAELVPARLRGRYFGRRTAACTAASGGASLAAGLLLDRAGPGRGGEVALAALALVACAAGALSTWLMARQHSARPRRVPLARAARLSLAPALHPRGRRLLAFSLGWSGAVGLAGPFFTVYLVRDLRAGYAAGALYAAGLAAARVASAPLWGRALDRAGPRAVLVLCSLGLAATPLTWLLAAEGRLWPVALDAVLGGGFAAGHALAMFALPLAVAPPRERPFWHAGFAVAGGAGYALASALGGHASASPAVARLGAPIPLLLALSAVARVGAAGLALGLDDAPVAAAPRKREAALAASSAVGSSPGRSPPFAPWGSRRWEESSVRRVSTSAGVPGAGSFE